MEILIIDGIPIPWRAPFVGKRGSFNPRHQEMKILRTVVRQQYRSFPITGPVKVDLTFYMPIPKSASKKKQRLMEEGKLCPISRPDRTNMAKLYEDILNEIVIVDDSQIVSGNIEKKYSHRPHIIIKVEKIEVEEN